MKIYYIRDHEKIYANPRKENLYRYTKIAYYKEDKVYYGYIPSYIPIFSKERIEAHAYFAYFKVDNCIKCAIVKEAVRGQNIIE